MKTLLPIFMLILLTLPLPAHAQEEPLCEPDYTHATELWDSAQTALEDGDFTAAIDTFRELRRELSLIESECLGLNFEGDSDIVSDPVAVPEGLYRVTVTAQSMLVITSTPIEGECGEGRARDTQWELASLYPGDAETETSEALFYSDGCEVIFSYEYADAPYTVVWEKIK